MTIRRSAARLVSLAVAALFALAACALIADPVTRPVSGRDCIGVPAATCQGFLDQAEQDAPDGFGIVTGIRIACTTVCTEDAGEADIETTYANGRTLSSHTGWQTAGPGPGKPGGPPVVQVDPTPLPIRPTCIGVPELWCQEQAATALGYAADDRAITSVPTSVVVRCTGDVCTENKGDGVTIVSWPGHADSETGWSYNGAMLPSP